MKCLMVFKFPSFRDHAYNFVVAFSQFEQPGPFEYCAFFIEIRAECPEHSIQKPVDSLHIKFKHKYMPMPLGLVWVSGSPG